MKKISLTLLLTTLLIFNLSFGSLMENNIISNNHFQLTNEEEPAPFNVDDFL